MRSSKIFCLLALSLAALPCMPPTWAHATTDPKGDSADTAADIVSYSAAGKDGQLSLEISTAKPYGFANTQVLIDTDLKPETGFLAGSLGADVLIEGGNAYRFKGESPEAWDWDPIGKAIWQVDGNKLNATLDAKLLASQQVALTICTLDDKYVPQDVAPDRDALLVNLKRSTKPTPVTKGSKPPTEAKGDADDASHDLISVQVKQDKAYVVIDVKTAAAFDFGTTLVLFDTDGDATTGYQPPADPRFGFEYMLSGGTLSKHQGADRAAWSWAAAGQAEQSPNGASNSYRLDAAALNSERLHIAVWNMSADWQTLVDQAPDQGLYELHLSSDMMKPAPSEPQIAPASPKANRDLSARQRVAESQSFYCYYGSGRVAELSHYDVVILHDPQMSRDDIAKLKALGVVTVGYISVGEDDTKRPGNGTGPAGLASWYFDKDADDQPDRNAIWNSWYANAADPNWRTDRVAEAKRLVQEVGYDGIFLDTIDTAQIYPDSADGMVQLLADLREALPGSPIVLNQGFTLFDKLAPMADALMLESFTATYDFQDKQYLVNYPSSLDQHTHNVNKNLNPVLVDHPMPIFVLDYALSHDRESIQTAADRAATFGYQFAAAPIFLDDVYANDIVGQPDPRWLEKQATPELLTVMLAEPANGFPAGAKLIPSSCYAAYSVAPLVDGIEDRSSLHWSRAAWASSEDEESAWLQIDLGLTMSGGQLLITWATDSGVTHVSQSYELQARTHEKSEWQSLAHAHQTTANTSAHMLPDQSFTALRLVQPADGGSTERPSLMWIAQLELLND